MTAGARSAVVVGAGVAGLAAAGGLARAGWRVTLLERADRLRGRPSALLLWPSGVRALQAIGLGEGLDAVCTPVPDRGVRRPDGSWLIEPDPSGPWAEALLVHAEDLHDALVAGLGDRVEVRTGVTVAEVGSRETASVTDGHTIWQADLVVAADGRDSRLRERVAPRSTLVSAGATAWRAVVPWFRAPALTGDLAAGGFTRSGGDQGGGYSFFSAPLGTRSGSGGSGNRGGYFLWATVSGAPRPEGSETQRELLRRWFDGWHAPVPELLAATEPADLLQEELRTLRPAPHRLATPLGQGALVLLGDAAHAVPEFLGQGACLALEDAATLVGRVRAAAPGAALHKAVAGYGAARRARAAQVRRHGGRLVGTGPWGRLAPVQRRRRARAARTVASWHPPA